MKQQEKKRSTREKREGIQRALEKARRFDYEYISFGKHWKMPEADYDYRGNVFRRMTSAVLCSVMATVGALLIKVVYGARVVGRKNLKLLKKQGAVCVCNHVAYLDTLFIRQAVGHFRSYHTIAPQNNKTGVGGWFIRRANVLPISSNLTAARSFNREVDRLLRNGKIVNFYAERAMWVNYRKPRPMKEGAFYYAVKSDAPVLPVFFTFRKDGHGRMRRLRIHILPPVRADEGLCRKEAMAQLKERAEAAWRECYEREYGIPLSYLS